MAELAEIAGYLHDVGNLINREYHAQTGAVIAYKLLEELGMDYEELAEVMMAIGNHHEEDGTPVSPVAAALILADKSDVHRSRVRPIGNIEEDIHDRVNYAATFSKIIVDREKKIITYKIEIDTDIAPVMEYFQIFLSRMLIASKAAKRLGCKFELIINDTKMI
jgi:metal-dependent HD superfamily phosphatase/phosphodiesterase